MSSPSYLPGETKEEKIANRLARPYYQMADIVTPVLAFEHATERTEVPHTFILNEFRRLDAFLAGEIEFYGIVDDPEKYYYPTTIQKLKNWRGYLEKVMKNLEVYEKNPVFYDPALNDQEPMNTEQKKLDEMNQIISRFNKNHGVNDIASDSE
ncbi:hypothetical protein CAEBREN_24095 [Caenorhabditis brenneri]|uniref:Uncharacterized protein n=1 Tax=Caenorhabditis brenneri TaxID=135651 RepID=G0NC71_CAEBE|nr:hypothetical protein CAEBREN_24095 [Caenorhabditis brenneri]